MELMRNYVKIEDCSVVQYRFVAFDPNLIDKSELNSIYLAKLLLVGSKVAVKVIKTPNSIRKIYERNQYHNES